MSIEFPTRRDRVRERIAESALGGMLASLGESEYIDQYSDDDLKMLADVAARAADALIEKLYP